MLRLFRNAIACLNSLSMGLIGGYRLERHLRNRLICLHDPVADLHHHFKRHVRFFDREHRGVNVFTVAAEQTRDLVLRVLLKRADLLNGGLKG